MIEQSISLCCIVLLLIGCAVADTADAPVDVTATAVPLSDQAPEQTEIGTLRYLGGLSLTANEKWFGGFSGLRWRDGRLYSVSDKGAWISFEVVEKAGILEGIKSVAHGRLKGRDGARLSGKKKSDAESLAIANNGDWLVGFERDHRIERYTTLDAAAQETEYDLPALFGHISQNRGLETFAKTEAGIFGCVERQSTVAPNCMFVEGDGKKPVAVTPPTPLDKLGATPTDAVTGADGEIFILFRSYSSADGNGAAIVRIGIDGSTEALAVLRPPMTLDNMEGLAYRAVGARKFLYLISDDNFSPSQRTLLMKFEIIEAG